MNSSWIATPWSTSIRFDVVSRYMPQQLVNGPVTFTRNSNPSRHGGGTQVMLVADGINSPLCSGMVEHPLSAGYDNRAGVINQASFWCDGTQYFYAFTAPLTAAVLAARLSTPIRAQTATSDTLVLADQNGIVTENNAAAITQFIPTDAAVPIPIGSLVTFVCLSANQVTFTPAGGVTFVSKPGVAAPQAPKSLQAAASSVGAVIQARKIAANTWSISGDVV